MNLINTIKFFQKTVKRSLFTTPTHNQGAFVPPLSRQILGRKVFEADFSEIDGFDNIREPEGIFLDSQAQAAEIYGAQNSFYLFNGSSSGIMALMTSCCKENDKILVSRNCHVSVYNALVLTGAYPVWIMPEFLSEWGICGQLTPDILEKSLQNNTDAKAVFITNPTYEGVISDVTALSATCKKFGVPLIVDEAHGALWHFSEELPDTAILCGADASVQSLHKTAGALTQSAILHLSKNSEIKPQKIQECLNIINSTSPSYPLLASIEGCIDFIASHQGKSEIQKLIKTINEFKIAVSQNDRIKVFNYKNDVTKLFIAVKGLSGNALSEILGSKYNIEDEMATSKGLLFLCGLGTTPSKLNLLKDALLEVASEASFESLDESTKAISSVETVLTPRQAFFALDETVSKNNAVGKISKELILPYPPGVPIIMPGERLKQNHWEYLDEKVKVVKEF